jgi:hypothetical protein
VLTIQTHPQTASSFSECFLAALKNVSYRFSNVLFFKTAGGVCNWRERAVRVRPCLGDDNLIRVCIDHQIGIVRYYYYLSFRFA